MLSPRTGGEESYREGPPGNNGTCLESQSLSGNKLVVIRHLTHGITGIPVQLLPAPARAIQIQLLSPCPQRTPVQLLLPHPKVIPVQLLSPHGGSQSNCRHPVPR